MTYFRTLMCLILCLPLCSQEEKVAKESRPIEALTTSTNTYIGYIKTGDSFLRVDILFKGRVMGSKDIKVADVVSRRLATIEESANAGSSKKSSYDWKAQIAAKKRRDMKQAEANRKHKIRRDASKQKARRKRIKEQRRIREIEKKRKMKFKLK